MFGKRALNMEQYFGNMILYIFQRVLFKKYKHQPITKVLIFRVGSLGDSICALPAIYSIRQNFKEAQIDLLTKTGGSHLAGLDNLLDNTLINHVINYDLANKKLLFDNIKSGRYQLIIELPQESQPLFRQLRNMLFFRLAKIPFGFGWYARISPRYSQKKAKLLQFEREPQRLLNILSKYITVSPESYPINITQSDIQFVNQLLAENGLTNTRQNVGIVVGSKRPQNRWPIAYFDTVLSFLTKAGFNCLLVGGPEDNEFANQLTTKQNVYNLIGKTSPVQSALVFKHCQFVVSNDTGPLHLAYSVNTFVFALFSSRDYPGKWFPPSAKSIVFRNYNIHCSECFSETCADNQCMKHIKPETVIEAISAKFITPKN
jgi:ADP-heptose:LPS heptosyltransferase